MDPYRAFGLFYPANDYHPVGQVSTLATPLATTTLVASRNADEHPKSDFGSKTIIVINVDISVVITIASCCALFIILFYGGIVYQQRFWRKNRNRLFSPKTVIKPPSSATSHAVDGLTILADLATTRTSV